MKSSTSSHVDSNIAAQAKINPDLIVEYLTQVVYFKNLGSSSVIHHEIRAVLSSYFTPDSCNLNIKFFIQGHVALPKTYDDKLTYSAFFEDLEKHLRTSFGESNLIGSTAGEASNYIYQGIRRQMEKTFCCLNRFPFDAKLAGLPSAAFRVMFNDGNILSNTVQHLSTYATLMDSFNVTNFKKIFLNIY